jgi:hypothetical protein
VSGSTESVIICDKKGCFAVVDEVVGGFGRLWIDENGEVQVGTLKPVSIEGGCICGELSRTGRVSDGESGGRREAGQRRRDELGLMDLVAAYFAEGLVDHGGHELACLAERGADKGDACGACSMASGSVDMTRFAAELFEPVDPLCSENGVAGVRQLSSAYQRIRQGLRSDKGGG